MKNKYHIEIFWSEEDDCFVSIMPEFPNLSAFGETHEEAVVDAKQVLQMAIESLKRDGIPLPPVKPHKTQQFSGQVRLRMPKSLHQELTITAEQDGASLNMHMVSLLSKHNTATSINQEIESKLSKLLLHQDQNFTILHKKLRQQQAEKDVIGVAPYDSWVSEPNYVPKFKTITN